MNVFSRNWFSVFGECLIKFHEGEFAHLCVCLLANGSGFDHGFGETFRDGFAVCGFSRRWKFRQLIWSFGYSSDFEKVLKQLKVHPKELLRRNFGFNYSSFRRIPHSLIIHPKCIHPNDFESIHFKEYCINERLQIHCRNDWIIPSISE